MIRLVIAFFLLASQASGVISSAIEWNVQTDGSNSNGGGFHHGATGTDWSLFAAAHQAYTDIVVGSNTLQVTSTLHPFAATDVGNIIMFTGGAGCTGGRFEVLTVIGVTASVDRSAGTAASTCTANLGGALLTIAQALLAIISNNAIHIKAGTYTVTTSLAAPGPNLYVEGYQTTYGDGGTKPLITTATDSTTLWKVANVTGGGLSTFSNLSFSNTASVRAKGLDIFAQTHAILLRNCTFDGFSVAINSDNGSSFDFLGLIALYGVEIKNGVSAIITKNTNNEPGDIFCYACYIHDNSSSVGAVQGDNISTQTYVNSVLSGNVNGAFGAQQMNFINSDIVSNTSDGAQTNGQVNAVNSIFYGNGRYGINCALGGCIATLSSYPATGTGCNNAFGANVTNNYSQGVAGPGEITLTANPFTSATSFTLNATAGGGPLLKKTGCTASITGSTTVGTLDVGAIQGSQGVAFASGNAH